MPYRAPFKTMRQPFFLVPRPTLPRNRSARGARGQTEKARKAANRRLRRMKPQQTEPTEPNSIAPHFFQPSPSPPSPAERSTRGVLTLGKMAESLALAASSEPTPRGGGASAGDGSGSLSRGKGTGYGQSRAKAAQQREHIGVLAKPVVRRHVMKDLTKVIRIFSSD